MMLYRRMTGGDVAAGLALCRSAGWNQVEEDWKLFLELSPKGCCVAVDDQGKVRGTVATVRYEDRFAWIGMVLVDPVCQRQGIGMALLREALGILKDERTMKLDATPAGRNVYLKLGFVDEYRILRMELKRGNRVALTEASARIILHTDLAPIFEFDREVFGADRSNVLSSSLGRAPQCAFLVEEAGVIKGYCFSRPGHNFTHIGPVIAEDVRAAKDVLAAALRTAGDKPVVVDAPVHHPAWLDWLSSIGFTEQRPLIRMCRGDNAYPGLPERQFAILGPEFG